MGKYVIKIRIANITWCEMPQTLEIDSAAIIILGSFNPGIFHPIWFKANGLIKPEEADKAKLEVTTPMISIFGVEWFRLQVETQRFVIQTDNETHFELLSDLVIGTFSLLEHTPVSAMGLNRMMHFKMDSEESWNALGNKIAPKDVWQGVLQEPGLLSLVMQGPKQRPNQRTEDVINVRIESSPRITPGIYIDVNNHFEIKDNDLQKVLNILKESWRDVLINSRKIADQIIKEKD
jgi:hypothetical protein